MSIKESFDLDSRFKSKILIVDDDRQHLEMLSDCIEDYVSNIITANNGIEAISKATTELPDIILMDIMMPEMNGFDACKQIKEDSRTTHIPVIFITALNDLDSILEGFASGGVDYVSKPFHTREILSRLKIHLRMQHQQRQLIDLAIELKATKEEAEAARIVAEKANQAKTNFLCNVSHELMTPMNMIMNMTHFAIDSGLTSKQRQYLEKIKSSSALLKELIDDILEYSKIEIGVQKTYNESFELKEIINHVYNQLRLKIIDSDRVQLILAEDPLIPPQLIGDFKRLQKILFHLGDNAIKFTSQGSVTIKTRLLELKDNQASVGFSIKDTGIGMDKAQQELLFQPFVQADSSKTRKYGGVGLGLALCRQLIKLMNGKIFIKSTPNKGSVVKLQFDFHVPEKQASNQQPIEKNTIISAQKNESNTKTSGLIEKGVPAQNISELLDQLQRNIKKRNPKKCKEICDLALELMLDKSMRERIEQIQDNLRRYQFKVAQDLLQAINNT
ncbi:MAG: signal transduction histidine kinase [Candidatus Magnetoglobus multicellularis str. Araruama]|uniref:histidine kinase n=1 Tax=Candidatus Magnetoglobus multicellularis str. Araruama TaxID=890399 RepID=A0A1V1P5J5_9BACT|nr:MAG: signal transduction histidine kinase [Candidatus Magnetoglobus multicellularis str. Araruama]